MEIILRDEDLFGKQKGISLAKDLNSSPIGKELLEKISPEKDLNSSPLGRDLLEM